MRARWIILAALLVALDAYLIGWHWQDVAGNVEAQFIIVNPAFLAHHLATKRRQERLHAETQARLDAQDETLAAAHQQVTEIHPPLTA